MVVTLLDETVKTCTKLLFVIVGDFFIIVIQSNLYLAVSCFPLIAVIFTSLKQLPLLTI